jgi:hypothetical protein
MGEMTLMTTSDDDLLLDELRRVFGAIDPVPEPVQAAARAAIEWRTIDAELAALVSDSLVDEPLLAVRGTAELRMLTFEADELTIELEAEPAGDGSLTLVGQLVPPQPAQIAIRHGMEVIATHADDRGRFAAGGVGSGPISLSCRLDDQSGASRLVETTWLSI